MIRDEIKVRQLTIEDKPALEKLIKDVEDTVSNKAFWLPISEESENHFFDVSWTVFLGAFLGGELLGALGLFFDENEYGESRDALNLEGNIAEYGRAMVLSEYRNKGIMNIISKEMNHYVCGYNLEYLVATVHPDNEPSQKFLKKDGFIKKGHIVKMNKYPRDILVKKL